MKKIQLIILILIFTLNISIKTFAQFENHTHRATVLDLVIDEKGSKRELKSIINNWIEKVGKSNPNILNYELIESKINKNKMQFVITEEYDSWYVLHTGGNSIDNLIELDYKNRRMLLNELSEYISSHDEELFQIEEPYMK